MAEQATAAVMGKYGDTVVLATVVMKDEDKKVDFFPLTVDYEERFYAAGKIIGSRFVRREGRPSDEAILSGRIVDRTIRPLFDHRLRREVQVVITVLSVDEENDPDFIALLTVSTALSLSKIPWNGPVAGIKVMKRVGDDAIVINPTNKEVAAGFELVGFVGGAADGINMIELEGIEASEEHAVTAFSAAEAEIKKLIAWQKEIQKEIGAAKEVVPLAIPDEALTEKIKAFLAPRLEKAVYTPHKGEREAMLADVKSELDKHLVAEGVDASLLGTANHVFEDELDAVVHKNVLEKEKRPDGRRLDEVRDLYAETGLFSRTHGSALFVRGNTQALAITTLGPPSAQQLVETIEFSGKKRFLLHYNFPSYSVGETGPFRGPSRRDIGHGSLAGKAIRNLIPSAEEFPYTIRVVSEILSSNGSSSMATVCASSLSLMDAGVPMKKPAAGIAMGLMSDQNKNYKILTDIQGPEDHYGDMDFKAAGTADGVTAIQMDVKISGVSVQVLAETLAQAKQARLHILSAMNKVLSAPRPQVSSYAPMILVLSIPPSKIGEVIGPGGKVINGIIEKTGALSIDIEEDGRVFVTGSNRETAQAAYDAVASIVKVYELGDVVEGTVVKILEFGAIVEFGPHRDGMIHVSELKNGFVKKVEDVLKVGDFVRAKIIRLDPDGRIGLSLKAMTA
jgi:polyribonucleotide nucleotidyltransferase